MRWFINGKQLWDALLPVGSDSWRTWAYITLRPGMVGPGKVQILNEDDELLKTESFEIVPAEKEKQSDTSLKVARTRNEEAVSLEGGENLESSGNGTSLTCTFLDASSIPDQPYDVTVNAGLTHKSQAVLFDVPDDGMEVFLRYTYFTRRVGIDSPRKYIKEFKRRIRFYRTIRIGDPNGTVKAYLLVPTVTNYWIRPRGSRIEVSIESTASSRGGGDRIYRPDYEQPSAFM
jgi:hypothetical protein